jgi:hypothetical protein
VLKGIGEVRTGRARHIAVHFCAKISTGHVTCSVFQGGISFSLPLWCSHAHGSTRWITGRARCRVQAGRCCGLGPIIFVSQARWPEGLVFITTRDAWDSSNDSVAHPFPRERLSVDRACQLQIETPAGAVRIGRPRISEPVFQQLNVNITDSASLLFLSTRSTSLRTP